MGSVLSSRNFNAPAPIDPISTNEIHSILKNLRGTEVQQTAYEAQRNGEAPLEKPRW